MVHILQRCDSDSLSQLGFRPALSDKIIFSWRDSDSIFLSFSASSSFFKSSSILTFEHNFFCPACPYCGVCGQHRKRTLSMSTTPPTTEEEKHVSESHVQTDIPQDSVALLDKESPGVKRVEIISSHIHLIDRVFLFSSIFLIAYVYGLDNQVRLTYQVLLPDHIKRKEACSSLQCSLWQRPPIMNTAWFQLSMSCDL